MDILEKKVCIEWFNEAINSKFGSIAEGFLSTFPFPRQEVHTMYSFAKSIENDCFSSIEDMIVHFKEEVSSVTTFLGCSSPATIYIRGYFKELIDKLEIDFLGQGQRKLDFSSSELIDISENVGDDLPNDLNSFLKMSSESSYPTLLEINPIRTSTNDFAAKDSVQKLDNKLKDVPTDHNLTHIAEIIRFYQNTSNDGDESTESFKFDLSKLSENTLNKINEYIEEIISNKSSNC